MALRRRESAEPRSRKRPSRTLPDLELSRGAFWLLSIAIVSVYLLLWAINFRYIYGWFLEDRALYGKALDIVHDWRRLFHDYYNAYHMHFLFSWYLPLKTSISLPSYPVPGLQDQTGQFRFVLLYTVLLHGLLLVVWAAFAASITSSRMVALLSLLLFATSPTFVLWSPEPDSRLLGLPFVLVGLWILFHPHTFSMPGRRQAGLCFLAGSLFGFAQSIHYTSLYLVLPFCVVFWGLWLLRRWRERSHWRGLVSFGLGCIWLQGALELISDVILGIPWEQGPTMALFNIRMAHSAPGTLLYNLAAWRTSFLSQMGLPLLVAISVGWVMYLKEARTSCSSNRMNRLIVGASIAVGLIYLALSGSIPFFRQTSVLQPFLFLFASVAIVWLARRVMPSRSGQSVATILLLAVVGAVPWAQAAEVFQGHQGLGRAIEWAYANKGDRHLQWLPVSLWTGDPGTLSSLEQLEASPPDSWLIIYYPRGFASGHPSLRPYLEDARPLASWPSFRSAGAWLAEQGSPDPLMDSVRVLELSALLESMQGRVLTITSVSADSVADPSTEPVNVFDRDASPDGATAWLSGSSPMPHVLEITFGEAVPLAELRIISSPPLEAPPPSQPRPRISALEVQAADERGTYRSVWMAEALEQSLVVSPRWDPSPTTAIRVLVRRQRLPWADTNQASIEEIVFPGYRVLAPKPERSFPDLMLTRLRLTNSGIEATGSGLTKQTFLLIGGSRLPTREVRGTDLLLASLPEALRASTGAQEAYLSDSLRRSNGLRLIVAPPVIRQLHPASSSVSAHFNAQPDGSSAFAIDTDDATPDTVVLLDGEALRTAFGQEHLVTAIVPQGLIDRAGRHIVSLKNLFGESNAVEFVVTP